LRSFAGGVSYYGKTLDNSIIRAEHYYISVDSITVFYDNIALRYVFRALHVLPLKTMIRHLYVVRPTQP